jgi:hypothetical protein
VIGLEVPVPVNPPGEEVTVYPVIGAPPVEEGAVKDTEAWALPALADTDVGAPGTVAGNVAIASPCGLFPTPTVVVTDPELVATTSTAFVPYDAT